MVRKKKTKPVTPGKKEVAIRLWIIRWLQYSNVWKKKNPGPYRFATLWEAATEYIKTKDFKELVRTAFKKKSKTYIDNFLNFKDVYGNEFKTNKTQRQVKFVLNMLREVKSDIPKKMLPFEMPKPTTFDKTIMTKLYQGLGSFIRKKN